MHLDIARADVERAVAVVDTFFRAEHVSDERRWIPVPDLITRGQALRGNDGVEFVRHELTGVVPAGNDGVQFVRHEYIRF